MARRDRQALADRREALIENALPLARQLARRYRHSEESLDDLEQVAYLGLVKAADRYDPDRGPFVSYAAPTILGELGRTSTPREIAADTGLAIEDVVEAISAASAYTPAALDAPLFGADPADGGSLGETLGIIDSGYELVELRQSVGPALRALSPRDQQILHLRFVEDLTQSEIAARVGISQMHVSRLLRRALDELQAAASDQQAEAA